MKNGLKKIVIMVIATLCMTCLFACGEEKKEVKTKKKVETDVKVDKRQKVDISKPENIKEYVGSAKDLGKQVSDMVLLLEKKHSKLRKNIGNSFEGYQAHRDDINEYYALILSDSKASFDQLSTDSLGYFKRIFREYAGDEDKLEDAIDDYYDEIYDGVLDDYYDDVYDGILDQIYDDYYSGVLDDVVDKMDYDEWSSLSSEAYKSWSTASSDVFKTWNKISSGCYEIWSEASNQLWNEGKDINELMAKMSSAYIKSQVDQETEEPEETKEPEETEIPENGNDATTGIREDLKEALDSYEEFVDEYVEFLKEFKESDDITSMMNDYNSYMAKYTETMSKIQQLDTGDLSKEEAAYYLEVVNRINQKIMEAV